MTQSLGLTKLTEEDQAKLDLVSNKINSALEEKIGTLASAPVIIDTGIKMSPAIRREVEIKYWEAGWTVSYDASGKCDVLKLIPGHGGRYDF